MNWIKFSLDDQLQAWLIQVKTGPNWEMSDNIQLFLEKWHWDVFCLLSGKLCVYKWKRQPDRIDYQNQMLNELICSYQTTNKTQIKL